MARRRSIGSLKHRKIGTEELKRNKYSNKANHGQLSDDRFGFKSTKNGKLDVCVFYAKFAAKIFLDLMIQDDEITWLNDDTIQTSQDVIIYATILRKIYDHKLTPNEVRYYKLNQSYETRATIIRSDDHAKIHTPGEDNTTGRRSRKGMVLIGIIAEELGMKPREARGILRKKMKKPDRGWAWQTIEEVNRIKSILKGTLITINFKGSKETS